MPDLILRRSTSQDDRWAWALQIRDHGPVETDYHTICRIDQETAERIAECGAPFFLYGPPNEETPSRKIKRLEKELEESRATVAKLAAKLA